MQGHGKRNVYLLVNEEPVTDLPFMPVNNILSATTKELTHVGLNRDGEFRFGRMFPHLKARKKCEVKNVRAALVPAASAKSVAESTPGREEPIRGSVAVALNILVKPKRKGRT